MKKPPRGRPYVGVSPERRLSQFGSLGFNRVVVHPLLQQVAFQLPHFAAGVNRVPANPANQAGCLRQPPIGNALGPCLPRSLSTHHGQFGAKLGNLLQHAGAIRFALSFSLSLSLSLSRFGAMHRAIRVFGNETSANLVALTHHHAPVR